jgi:hypothetical protein
MNELYFKSSRFRFISGESGIAAITVASVIDNVRHGHHMGAILMAGVFFPLLTIFNYFWCKTARF